MNQSYAGSAGQPLLPTKPRTRKLTWIAPWLALLVALVLLPVSSARAATGPLVFEGGEPGVQHRPKVHLILWGGASYWQSAEGVAIRQNLEGLYQALSGSSWTGILTQYYDYATHPSSAVALAPTYVSTYNPSANVDYNTVPVIVEDAIKAQKAAKLWGEVTRDSQYVVVAHPGAAYNTNFLANACAWHSWGELDEPGNPQFNFTFLFNYAGTSIKEKCKLYSSDPMRILTTLASHEFAETVTDPLPSEGVKRGWVSHDPAEGGHTISDVCTGTENVGQPGPGGYYVNPLWDNWKGGCQLSDSNPPFPSPQQPHPLVQANGKINLFWRGADGKLDYSWSQTGGEKWSDVIKFSSLGQPTAGQPSAVETSAGKISVFWKSGQEDIVPPQCFDKTDGYLREMHYNGSSWESKIPCFSNTPIGPLGGPPVAIAQLNGPVNVFWRGTDNALWYATRTSGAWSAPTSVGGSLSSNPSVVRAGADTLHLFWKAPNDTLQHRTYNETTKAWSGTDTIGNMNTGSYGGPTALARSGGAVEAVWPSSSGMRRAWHNGSSWIIEDIADGPFSPNPQFSAAAVPIGTDGAQLWYTGNDGQLWTSTYSSQGGWSASSVFASGGVAVGTQPQAAVTPSGNTSVYWMDPNIEGAYAAWNIGGWHGPTLVSPMEPIAPTAKTGRPSKGTESSATLGGTIHPGRDTTKYYFQYGPTTAYGSSTAISTVSGSFPREITISLSGLTPATTYHYRLVAENSVGKSEGQDEVFTTGWNLNSVDGSRLTAVSCPPSSSCMAVGYKGADPLIARWNGTEWQPEASQEPEGGAAQESVLTGISCTFGSSFCMAVGYYRSAAGKYLTWAQRRNGSQWELVNTQNKTTSGETFNFLDGVSCLSPSQCVAVGHYLTRTAPGVSEVTKAIGEYLNGGNFTLQELPTVGSSTHMELKGVSCYASNECTAVGYYASGPGQWKPLEGQWFGPTGWTAAALPLPAEASNGWLYGISCPAPDYCKAAGAYMTPSQSFRPLAERRNGPKWTTWVPQTPPNPEGSNATYLYGVTCTGKDDCIAVGKYGGASFGSKALAEAWDGNGWKAQYPFNPKEVSGSGALELSGVSCRRRGACSAVGFFLNQTGFLSALANSYSIKVPPTVATTEATNLKSTEATLNGTVNPNGTNTTYYFEYGPTTSYGSSTTPAQTGLGELTVPVSTTISELAPNSTYHFRIVASNGTGGTQVGKDMVFTTDRGWSIEWTPNPEEANLTRFHGVACASDTYCTAVGEFESFTSAIEPIAEEWAGTSWAIQPMAEGTEATALKSTSCVSASECLGVGYFRNGSGVDQAIARRWTGSKWEAQSLPLPAGTTASSLTGISCTQIGKCAAVGYYETSAEVRKVLIERWTGSNWEVQASPEPAGTEAAELSGVSCARWQYFGPREECIAVGNFTKLGTVEPLSMRWIGFQWEVFAIASPSGADYARLAAVSCSPPATLFVKCVAVGHYSSAGVDAVMAQRRVNFEWEEQSIPTPEGDLPRLTGVSCPTPTSCFAVGTYDDGEGSRVFGEQWQDPKWELEAMPEPEGSTSTVLNGIHCTPSGICAAVGHYEDGSGASLSLAERYS